MALFRDKRGRFFSIPESVLSRFVVESDAVTADSFIETEPSTAKPDASVNAGLSTASTIVIIVLPGRSRSRDNITWSEERRGSHRGA